MSAAPDPKLRLRHLAVAFACTAFVVGMVGMAYAAVPLYQLFCRVTGFGGATWVAEAAPDRKLERTIRVRFDANVAPGLPWDFRPEQPEVEVKLGETKLVYYRAHNRSRLPTTGIASYNVTPGATGTYFAKLQCFCFEQQTLQPGESLEMPVVFFVDPALAEDGTLDRLRLITLSYTFFAAKPPASPVAAAGAVRPSL
jgi:cytochrome c oxidase assembly protein subunit 11